MQLAVAAAVLDHVDRVPSGLADDVVYFVGAKLDQGANRHPAAAIVRAEKRPLHDFLAVPAALERHLVDGIHGQQPTGHVPRRHGNQHQVNAPAEPRGLVVARGRHGVSLALPVGAGWGEVRPGEVCSLIE